MPQFMESLESRTFLSADPALTAIKTEGKALIATVVAYKKETSSDLNLVKADLKSAGETKSSKAVFKTLKDGAKANGNVTKKAVNHAVSLIKKDVTKGIAVVAKLLKHPGNAKSQAKLAADITTLQNDAAAALTTITNDLSVEQAADATNLTAVVNANPSNAQLATDASTTIPTNSAAAQAAVATHANTFLVTDVTAVVTQAQLFL